MSSRSETEWEEALLVAAGLWIAWRVFGSDAHPVQDVLKSWFEPSLPKGMRLPGSGEVREVPAVRTVLDVKGFPDLFNQALQIVEAPGFALEQWAQGYVELQPTVNPPDPEYDGAAHVFAAHAALETDNGRAVWNDNVGNLTTNSGDFYTLRAADVKDGTTHRFQNFNFPLQGAVAMAARVKRLWPNAYKFAFSGVSSPVLNAYATGLQGGALKYAGANVSSEQLASSLNARAKQLGYV